MDTTATVATIEMPAGAFTSALEEKQRNELAKYETRYVYAPFADCAHSSLPLGYAPVGEIYPVPAPERQAMIWMLPDSGAQVLRVDGVNKNVAIYLDEPGPIVTGLLQTHGREGLVEIGALRGMSDKQYYALKIDRIIFGDEIPRTAATIRARMQAVLDQAGKMKGESSEKFAAIARQILAGVDQCERYCLEVLQATHAEMDTAKAGNPEAKKRYDKRDFRAIEFIDATPREQVMASIAQTQQQQASMVPEILKRMDAQEERWAQIAQSWQETMAAQTEALKVIAAKAGKEPAVSKK